MPAAQKGRGLRGSGRTEGEGSAGRSPRRAVRIRRLGVRIPSGALVETATETASDLRKRGTEADLVLTGGRLASHYTSH